VFLAKSNGRIDSSEPNIRYKLASSAKDAALHGPTRTWPPRTLYFRPPFTDTLSGDKGEGAVGEDVVPRYRNWRSAALVLRLESVVFTMDGWLVALEGQILSSIPLKPAVE
jgi:hypothetical protein